MLGEEITVMDKVLQYGALGIVLLMVIMTWLRDQRTARVLEKKDQKLSALTSSAISFIGRACNLLEQRPCLKGHVYGTTGLDVRPKNEDEEDPR